MTETETPRPACSVSQLLADIAEFTEQPLTLQKIRPRDWEARTYSGAVGRGRSAGDALAELLENLLSTRRRADQNRLRRT